MRAKANCARAMLIRKRFEARDEREAMVYWVNHRPRRVPVPEKYIRHIRLRTPFRKWREYAAGRRIEMDEADWRTPEEHDDDDDDDTGDQGGDGNGNEGSTNHTTM